MIGPNRKGWSKMKDTLRTFLILISISGLLMTSGCSWFPNGGWFGSNDSEYIDPSDDSGAGWNDGGDVPPMPEGAGGDMGGQGIRPGETSDYPEMNVIYFDFNRFNIRSDQHDRLARNLKYLLDHPKDKVYIEGHCDERGTIEYNFNLGQRRANIIREHFITNGITAGRIATVSKGEENPAAPGHTQAVWAKNRRCEFQRMH
jgi:peptidoglycan-associated lipoprotein